MRLSLTFVVAGLAMAALPAAAQPPLPPPPPPVPDMRALSDMVRAAMPRAYQGRNAGPEQTERFSRKVKLGRDGRVSLSNVAGDITVTAGSGDEVSIEAVKRTHGDRNELAQVQITVDDRPGRVDIRTEGEQNRTDRNRRGTSVAVDYTVSVPAAAAVELHSVSGSVKVTGVRGSVRVETVSGDVAATDAPKLELAKSVSGDLVLSGIADSDLTAGSISGRVTVKNMKGHGLELSTVSGETAVTDSAVERLSVKTISGTVDYDGTIARAGRYDINSHSGNVRLALANPAGFELAATSFSGSVRSELPLTIGGDSTNRDANASRRRSASFGGHDMRATFGDGSAAITIRTFSGSIVIAKK
jgi:DUF4097 and DUF4098 domain-containing protein YvlB